MRVRRPGNGSGIQSRGCAPETRPFVRLLGSGDTVGSSGDGKSKCGDRPDREGRVCPRAALRPGRVNRSFFNRQTLALHSGLTPYSPCGRAASGEKVSFRLRKQELRWHPSAAIPPRDRPTVREPPLPSLQRQSRPGSEGSRFLFLIVIPAHAGIQGICLFTFYPCSLPLREAMKRHNIFTLSGSGSRHAPE